MAWDAYFNAHKSPITEKAGAGFKDPDYDLSVEWKAASDRIKAAQAMQQSPGAPSRVLIVNASARNDYTCPGEMSKSFRLGKLAQETPAFSDWLDWMGLVESDAKSCLDRFIGYYEPYATSHTTLDNDDDMQREVVNVAKAVAACVTQIRRGREAPDAGLKVVRAK